MFFCAAMALPRLYSSELKTTLWATAGWGRLAACFLDSAATQRHPAGRVRHPLPLRPVSASVLRTAFKKKIAGRLAALWRSVERSPGGGNRCWCSFADQTVRAVPYDMPVIGYGDGTVNTLRLWQAEAVDGFDFDRFNAPAIRRSGARERTRAEDISAVLYPNDDTDEGKRLRLKQQYFFTSAVHAEHVVREYCRVTSGEDFSRFAGGNMPFS